MNPMGYAPRATTAVRELLIEKAAVRYLVLPQRPAATEKFTEEQLAALVTRDAMIGVVKVSVANPNAL
jgi:Nitrile hydratase, alpha chain